MANLVTCNDASAWKWDELPLEPVLIRLDVDKAVLVPFSRLTAGNDPRNLAAIVPWRQTNAPLRHVIVVTPSSMPLYRNGSIIAPGLACLSDHDCLRIGRELFFYDAFTRPQPDTYIGPPGLPCAFCRGDLVIGETVVLCPTCGLTYHHDDAKNCWLANTRCTCGQLTDLEQRPSWLPAGLPRGGSDG